VVAEMADEVAVMYQGKIVEHGLVEQVLMQPRHEYTKTLLSAVPQLQG
jgi:peptide/nickel transport system ATP-binding protein